jgi:hypothetical protein
MCNKLFVVLLVLGLASGAMAATATNDNIQVQYSMDLADSMAGFMMNSATGTASLGPIGMAEETFLASTSGYVAGKFGEAVIMKLDGPLTAYDPNVAAWLPPNEEAGNIIDIQPEVESMEPDMKPFEDKTISMWVMKTAEHDSGLNHPGNDGTEYFLGSYFTYCTYISLIPNEDPNVNVSQLAMRAGGNHAGGPGRSEWIRADINMNEWYHVAMVLENVPGPIGDNMRVSCYVNGALIGAEGGLTRATDAFRWGAPRPWNLAAIGAYQCSEDMSTGHLQGGLVDDFAILNVPCYAATIADIYELGMAGMDVSNVPEPATIALLGLGGLALLRRKR